MLKPNRLLNFGLSMALGFSLVACSDDDAGKKSNSGEEGQEKEPIEDDDPPIEEPEEPENGWQVILVPSMTTDVEIARKAQTKLRVMLVSIEDEDISEGVANKTIKWTVAEGGKEFVTTKLAQTQTDENGFAEVVINAKDNEGSTTITASYKEAPKTVPFNITVTPLPTGSMRVISQYTGYANPQDYMIYLYDRSEFSCSDFVPTEVPNVEPLLKEDASATLFEKLSPEANYSVVVFGYGANGAPVASGCLNANNVYAEQTTETFVVLSTINLDPVSDYHVRSFFDFGDIVKSLGSVGKMITMITDFVDDPGGQTYSYLMQAVKYGLSQVIPAQISKWVSNAVDWVLDYTGLKDQAVAKVEEIITESQTGCQVGLFGCQLRNIVRTMELTGDLSIQKTSDIELTGKNQYNGLSVYWRIGCEDSTDPNCGRLHYSLDQLELGTKVNALEGSWKGSLSNGYDTLAIQAHDLSMYYGKIVTYLITHVLLPKIANGATDFKTAMAYWINCPAIAQWISETIYVDKVFGFKVDWGVSYDTAYGWCGSAASGLASALNFLSSMATLQKLNSNVSLSGTGILRDPSADNIVDHIDNGSWSGNMTLITKNDDGTTSTTSTAVNGVWSAYNKKNDGYCSYPKTASDSDDQICAFPPIDTSSLITNNMCSKYAACAK